jgi:hypothetical protein
MSLASDLDGTYTVTSLTSYHGPLQKHSDGITTIKGGKTFRVDETGCEWRSTFTWIDADNLKMVSIADPKNANKDFLLVGANGLPTAEPQTYECTMTVKRKGDRVQMTGTIIYGSETVFLTMRKIDA